MDDSSFEYYKSMTHDIDEQIEKLKERLEKKKEELTSGNKGFFDKRLLSRDIKQIEGKIHALNEYKSGLFELYYINNNNKYSLSEKMTDRLTKLNNLINEEETKELRSAVNETLRDANKDKTDTIKTIHEKLIKLAETAKISSKEFMVYSNPEFKNGYKGHEFFRVAVDKIKNGLLTELGNNYVFFHKEAIEHDNRENLISDLEDMFKSEDLKHDRSVDKIMANFGEIKETYANKERYEEVLERIKDVKYELKGISEVDVSEIEKYVSKLEKKYNKELDKANKYLSKYDFDSIQKQIADKKEKEAKERELHDKMVTYQHLAYELEKAMKEHPEDKERIRELTDQMEKYARMSGLTETELNTARRNGIDSYYDEIKEQQDRAKLIKAKHDFEAGLKSDVMNEIREEAIKELERSGAFKEEFEFRNGDAYAKPIDREAMIKAKMEELMQFAEMTPEQRGLHEFKKRGIVPQTATIEDLSYQQLNDIRIGYSDSSYGFIKDYKDWKKRESVKPEADTIYKEYIKYKASLENKSEGLSFADFAREKHKIENMTEIMVNQDLLDMMAEESRSKGFGK